MWRELKRWWNRTPKYRGARLRVECLETRQVLSTFTLHSNPAALHTIFLDFDGNTTTGTDWNTDTGVPVITTPAYSIDADPAFSANELAMIERIWARVAEDFMPFMVDVTTEAPADGNDLIYNGASDTRWGVRVAIGGSWTNWYGSSAGGVAYLDTFQSTVDTPCFVFSQNLGNNEKYIAEASSHEIGHTLGLRHDGRNLPSGGHEEYYYGHVNASYFTSWAPIMGVSDTRKVTQWSRGEYLYASNTEDDLSIITSNGFGYRPDDHGNTAAAATPMISDSEFDWRQMGIIETNTDVDVFTFTIGFGNVQIYVSPAQWGPNLDILAEVYDSTGSLVLSLNPQDVLSASVVNYPFSAGTYTLHVSGTGLGDPYGNGYSDYGSLGQYSVLMMLPPTDTSHVAVLPADSVKAEGNKNTTVFTFSVRRMGDITSAGTVQYSVTGSGASPASASDFASGVFPSGTVSFAAGESEKTITIYVKGDKTKESDEEFTVTLANPVNLFLYSASATGVIVNDDGTQGGGGGGRGGPNHRPVAQVSAIGDPDFDLLKVNPGGDPDFDLLKSASKLLRGDPDFDLLKVIPGSGDPDFDLLKAFARAGRGDPDFDLLRTIQSFGSGDPDFDLLRAIYKIGSGDPDFDLLRAARGFYDIFTEERKALGGKSLLDLIAASQQTAGAEIFTSEPEA